jgi:hypothetical protein
MPDERTTSKVLLQYMVAEPGGRAKPGKTMLEGWEYDTSEAMLAGPVCRRVAVIDIDPDSGDVLAGAPFVPPQRNAKTGKITVKTAKYLVRDPNDPAQSDFKQVSVFGAVMKTMAMFEEPDVLGRPLRWAFRGEQLLVVPRAGKMANAFYHRDSRSLQFFFFDAEKDGVPFTVHTCLSPDIVSHETTHAILDGIAPDLYDATSPQSLALHEAMADLGAVVFTLRTRRLLLQVLEETGGDIRKAEAFNQIGRQFGQAISGTDRPLRDLFSDASFGTWGTPPKSNDPHDLSLVLSAALYRLLVTEFEAEKAEIVAAKPAKPGQDPDAAGYSASGLALFRAGEKLKRMVFRGLDYLAPGEISFADYGRALIAADTSSNPDDPAARDIVTAEFVRRGIVGTAAELDPMVPAITLPDSLDLTLLVQSDWAAYQLAETLRADLMIPPGIPFDVRPRLDVTKTTWRTTGKATIREFIFKVAWRQTQLVEHPGDFFDEISITYGTTLVLDWETRSVRALLTTSPAHPSQAHAATATNAAMRAAFVAKCLDDGLLELGTANVQIQNRQLRLRGMGQMLHMAGH